VVIDNADGYMKVIVNTDNEPARNSYKKLSLQDYTQHPFIDGKIVVDMVDSFLVFATLLTKYDTSSLLNYFWLNMKQTAHEIFKDKQ